MLGGYEHSQSVTGDSDWTYLALQFDSGQRTKIQVCARLRHRSSTCTGKAWFDDLCLIPLEDPRPQSNSPLGRGAPGAKPFAFNQTTFCAVPLTFSPGSTHRSSLV